MLRIFDPFRGLELGGIIFRVIITILCTSMIGLERSWKNRPAGIRTHVLVGIGAAVASMTGHYIYFGMKLPSDVTRMGAQVISGLGFLGAGTILVTKDKKVRGLTTAAGLWTTGIIGLTIGAGFYEGGILCSILVITTEIVLGSLVFHMRHDTDIYLQVVYTKKDALDQMMRYCKDKNMSIKRLQVNSEEDDGMYNAEILLNTPWKVHEDEVVKHIYTINGIHSVKKGEITSTF